MTLDDFENVLTLAATCLGLLGVLFKYIKTPKRWYLLLITFFLANFLSDYYWTVYSLVMNTYPEVSEFLAYFGWNVGYLLLMVAVLKTSSESERDFFHPLMLWPILTNIVQFVLYIQYGGLLNNIWQVSITTIIMILCMQDILYYRKNKDKGKKLPYFAIVVLLFLLTEYGMWTASCFTFENDLLDPYFYLTIVRSILIVMFAWAAERTLGKASNVGFTGELSEFRYQMLFEAIVSVLIGGASIGGYILATVIKNSMLTMQIGTTASDRIVIMLFVISVALCLLVMLLVYAIDNHYVKVLAQRLNMDVSRRSRFSFIFTIIITFSLMLFVVIYNTKLLYNATVSEINEDAKGAVRSTAAELENYITVAKTTLRVVADSVDIMDKNGASSEEIYDYLVTQTNIQSKQFDKNFTGIYAYVDGVYMDGSGWIPPDDYDPESRDWYAEALEADGEIAIVSPYVDAQTGEIVVTFAKSLSKREGSSSPQGVVCLDVMVNYIQEITENVSVAGKGYGMVLDQDGFIIAHKDRDKLGGNANDVFHKGMVSFAKGQFDADIDGEKYTLFVHALMEKWVVMIAVSNEELLETVHSQLAVNILVSLIIFLLISFFYYFGYRIEQHNNQKVEELNMEVVSALAEAIDAKDAYTNGHSSRVAKYSRMIAEKLGFPENEQNELYMMGLLHDVGKIGVPDGVINKPDRLTDEEFAIIKTHPVIGGKILESIKQNPRLATGARWHHERYDGRGYPDGLAGEEIPEEARIIAVADAYDAMTSTRSYRGAMTQEKVRSEIEKGLGTQFDPRFGQVMLGIIDEDTEFTMRETLEEDSK